MAEMSAPTGPLPSPEWWSALDAGALRLSYDRDSDTLMVHLAGEAEPGVSIVAGDHVLIRMDRRRERVTGLQIEGFLAAVVPAAPKLLDALDVAELRGITLDEIARLRRSLATDERKREAARELLNRLVTHMQAAD